MLLKSSDTEWASKVSIFHDIDKPIVYETTWYSGGGETKIPSKVMDSDYLYVIPPHQEKSIDEFRKNNPLPPKDKPTSTETNTQENTNQQEQGAEQIKEEGTEQQQEEGTDQQQDEGTEEQSKDGTEEGTEEQPQEGSEVEPEGGTDEQPEDGTEQQEEASPKPPVRNSKPLKKY